jgi:HlyD family secretion protein
MSNPDLSQIVQSAKASPGAGKIIALTLVGVCLVTAVFVWRSMAAAGASRTSYVTELIERGDLKTTVIATGNLEPTTEVTVGSELSGTVSEVLVDTNDRVTKGQVLAKLDTSKLERQTESSRATAAAAEARVNQTKATLVESEASLHRLQRLKEASGGKLPSSSEMDAAIATADRAKADLASAEAEVLQAQANVGTNESDLEKAVIRSPIDGIVLTRDIEPGQTVAATMTAPELFVVAEKLENMKLEVAVAEADISRVKDGQRAVFTVDGWPNRSFEATVKKVEYGSTVTDNVVTYLTELEVTNDDLSLRPGMTATAEITVAAAMGTLLVPNAAFRFNPESAETGPDGSAPKRSFVESLIPGPPRSGGGKPNPDGEAPPVNKGQESRLWILREGKPSPIGVETGLSDGRITAVTGEGLAEGMPVITHAQTQP